MYEDARVKVFVATARTQGMRSTDYFSCIEGEVVHFGHACEPGRDPDQVCGCGHGFAGLSSHRGCSTAEVRELDFTRRDLIEALRSGLTQSGRDASRAEEEADRIIRLARSLPVGIVIERRLGAVHTRL
jgi:hypothetical protein